VDRVLDRPDQDGLQARPETSDEQAWWTVQRGCHDGIDRPATDPHRGPAERGPDSAALHHIGATTDLLSKRHDLGPAAYAAFAQDWVAAGATTVGGCCEVGPAHIAALAKCLRFNEQYLHTVVN